MSGSGSTLSARRREGAQRGIGEREDGSRDEKKEKGRRVRRGLTPRRVVGRSIGWSFRGLRRGMGSEDEKRCVGAGCEKE